MLVLEPYLEYEKEIEGDFDKLKELSEIISELGSKLYKAELKEYIASI